MNDYKEFLEHERGVILNKIALQKHRSEWYDEHDTAGESHQHVIEMLNRYVAMLDTLLEGSPSPDRTLLTCQEALKLTEEKHQRLVEDGRTNTDEWWDTLDISHFLSDLIFRIENWKAKN